MLTSSHIGDRIEVLANPQVLAHVESATFTNTKASKEVIRRLEEVRPMFVV